jgi:hypothetical protein
MPPGKPFSVSKDLANQLRIEYERGDNTAILSKRYGITKATVARNIRRVGGEIRNPSDPKPRRGLLGWLDS